MANAANVAVVHEEITRRAADHDAAVSDNSLDYALIAIQGPSAFAILSRRLDSLAGPPLAELKYYASLRAVVAGIPVLLARTGLHGRGRVRAVLPAGPGRGRLDRARRGRRE